ncbi:hypothetical protein LINPERHAP1_LOCUS14696 [Linum perenne]
MLKRLGEPHCCARSQTNNQATTRFIARDFLERFRINPDWEVNQIVAEVRLRYGIEDVTEASAAPGLNDGADAAEASAAPGLNDGADAAEASAAPGLNDGADAAMNEGPAGEPNQGPAVEPNEGYAADVDLEDRNVRPRTDRPIPNRLAGNGVQRRKNRCGTCTVLGHNARKCPTKQGVQVVTMNETDRRTVDREVAIAQNGVGITHFTDTGNTYFATGGGHRTSHMGNTNPDVGHEVASTIDLNTNIGTQPPQTQERE